MKSRYTLTGPCDNCPFRADEKFHGLPPERIIGIGTALLNGEDFMCHKTLDYTDDGPEVVARTRVCGGALATLDREGRSTQMQRISERMGLPVATPDPEAPVYGSIEEWINNMTKED